ncbi:MAG: peptidyl-prolyl cis-trans isomerase [Candidatus Eisenbacteria bacterium]
MLSQLRQNTKIVLWIVIVAFVGLIFVVWGMNLKRSGGVEAGFIGKIGNTRITVEEYRNEVANQRAAYYEDKGQRRGAQAEEEVNQKAWDAIVQNHLLSQEVQREELQISDDEVALEIQANPPAFIRSQPVFQTDSIFDPNKYMAALEDPQYDFRPLEAYVRAALPLQKLQDYLVSGVRVTDQEVRMMLAMLDDKATISYARVSPVTDVRDVFADPSDSDISAYYSSHTEDFKLPEMRKFKYVEFLERASAEDEGFARERIEEASDLISEGDSFEEIAAEYSDDEITGAKGGDLGWIKRGQLTPQLDSVAFSLEPGTVSPVIRTPYSYHLLKVDERRETSGIPEVKVRHILARVEPSPSTIEEIGSEARSFAELASKEGIEKAATEQSLKVIDSPQLAAEQVPGLFKIGKEDADAVFKQEKNEGASVLDGAQAFYVAKTVEVAPSHVPSLEEIKDRVKQAYLFSLKKEKARTIAAAVAQEAARGKTLEAASSAWNLSVEKTQPFTRTSNVPGIGRDNPVVARAFALSLGQTSGAVESGNDFFVIRLDARQAPDPQNLGGSIGQIKMSLLGTKQQAFVTDWYTELLSKAKITDSRSAETGGKARKPSTGYLYTGY